MPLLIRLIQIIYCLYAFLIFAVLTLLSFPLVMISLLFGYYKGGNLIYEICRYWASTWFLLIGVRHQMEYEHPHDTGKQWVFVANHISYMDIPPIVLMAPQPIRILGKFESSRIPIFGWIYRAAVIMVDRSNAETRAQSFRALKTALNKGLSIFLFPEGTFNMREDQPLKSFFDGAFRLAIETQTTIKPMILPDTIDRLHFKSLFTLTPGRCRVIFLEDVPVDGLQPADIPFLREKVYQIMDQALRRYRDYPSA
ncbi:MAG: 1-acyl-sn-glycerol-3-phosphate acyltransferase [Sediminibacterium sp.]|nr:1-acyl-sn-glycerol-3-phosphate acyltransferase [Sediminibacterium sp.]